MEAWANVYTELAVAIDSRRNGVEVPPGMLEYTDAAMAARGLAFVEAAIRSNRSGTWEGCVAASAPAAEQVALRA